MHAQPSYWFELIPGLLLGIVFSAVLVFALGRLQKLTGDRTTAFIAFFGGMVPGTLAALLFAFVDGLTKGVA
ncbi:MAG: hypothetical protein QM817_26280 [Archangium sp.]